MDHNPKAGARVQHRHTKRFGTVYRAAEPGALHATVMFDGDRFTRPVFPADLDYVRGSALDSMQSKRAS